MLSNYPAFFYKEQNGEYSVIFPDLNDLATCGSDLDEANRMAVDCLAGYIYSAKLDGRKIPSPSLITALEERRKAESSDAIESFTVMLCVDVEQYAEKHFKKAVKRTVTLPIWLDSLAKERRVNFSQTLQNALADKLGVSLDN
ncbi:MAG: type II toxin-antitoxin system HicB family antitoxin [Oscillospiraceae bacterium]|nr:type II toxin-antitoxin system HicB family antitoxin [Oscillospiraceae bacterium]